MNEKNEINRYSDGDLTESQALAIFRLIHATWPDEGESPEDITNNWLAGCHYPSEDPRPDFFRYGIWDGDQVVAHASTFRREIVTAFGPITILALADVCVDIKRQGVGMGAAIARRAFEPVDSGSFPAALFQTDVPGFYDNLDCRSVSNPFMNSKHLEAPRKNPWCGEHVMIYPADYDWPEGEIDLGGPGY